MPYSRTSADVLYDDRNSKVVVVPNEALSAQFGIANLVEAHRQAREYVIPKKQRDLVYAIADEMLRKGTAFTWSHGQTDIPVSEFGKTELTYKLFSDEGLGIKAQDYGDWLKGQGIGAQSLFFNDAGYAKSQKGPYVTRVRVVGPGGDFDVVGDDGILDNDDGAFGVRFEKTAEGGAKK